MADILKRTEKTEAVYTLRDVFEDTPGSIHGQDGLVGDEGMVSYVGWCWINTGKMWGKSEKQGDGSWDEAGNRGYNSSKSGLSS